MQALPEVGGNQCHVPYLILAELGQCRRAQGGSQQQAAEPAQQEEVPLPLTNGMFQPPKSAFTQGYMEKAIRFPCTLTELYSDQKTYSKRYAQAIQACRAQKDATICMETVKRFEETMGATLEVL